MFLAPKNKHTDDRGIAFLAVLAVMAVGLIVLALVTASLTTSLQFSSVDKANVQSQEAADSGLAAAQAGLNTLNNCGTVNGIYASAGNPHYRATIWRSTNGATWIMGCPDATSNYVRIISTGYPQNGPIGTATVNTTRYLDATYAYSPTATGLVGVAANYIYNIGSLDTYTVGSVSGANADVMVKTGDYSCTGPTSIAGNVVVAAGAAYLTNTCQLAGSVLATGNIQLTVQSGVTANATSTNGSVNIGNSTAYVTGNVYANGSVTVNGTVGGSIEAVGLVSLVSGGSVGGNIWSGSTVNVPFSLAGNIKAVGNVSVSTGVTIGGTIVTNGTISYNKKTGQAAINLMHSDGVIANVNQVTINAGTVVAPTPKSAPVVPAWADVFYKYSDWQAQGFNNLYTWPTAAGCTVDATQAATAYQAIKNLSVPTVVDARTCNTWSGNLNLSIKTDIAIFSQGFNFTTINVVSADGAPHKIWFIVPEVGTPTGSPICPKKQGGNDFAVSSSTSAIGVNISATVYTPCDISVNNGLIWRGLFYSGGMTGGGGVRELFFDPTGIPGSTVVNGQINPSTTVVGALIVKRNRSNNGE